ncbi:MAG: amidohydrolase family protein [Candidatus Latescibacteria bacterium]|nr:amidohydrolase family protein [Candidatus Latescibacterota bacterium]
MKIDCYVTLSREKDTGLRAGDLVHELDLAGVDKAVAAPGEREMAVYNQTGNNFILSESRKYPDRIIPACTVNPWYGGKAEEILHYAFKHGAVMLVLHPTIQGFLINDDLAIPLLTIAQHYKRPVYVHTGGHLYGSPWQLIDCAMRFPDVKFIMGHAGATDFWNDVPYAGKFAPNVYIEGSYARPFTFMAHLDAVGIDRGIMGSAAPKNSLVYEWEQYQRYMPDDTYSSVFGANLAGLLGINKE